MQKDSKLLPILLGGLCVYLLGYVYSRVFIFHAVERYGGAEGKGDPRQDYITKKDRSPGATVYTQVGSELVSIRAEWTQTVVARELK
jgi:hypothetical protein